MGGVFGTGWLICGRSSTSSCKTVFFKKYIRLSVAVSIKSTNLASSWLPFSDRWLCDSSSPCLLSSKYFDFLMTILKAVMASSRSSFLGSVELESTPKSLNVFLLIFPRTTLFLHICCHTESVGIPQEIHCLSSLFFFLLAQNRNPPQ